MSMRLGYERRTETIIETEGFLPQMNADGHRFQYQWLSFVGLHPCPFASIGSWL